VRFAGTIAASALVVAASMPAAPASAATAPSIGALAITGDPVVGAPLHAKLSVVGDPTPGIAYSWRRCSDVVPTSCTAIPGASSATYVPVAADAGAVLVVVVSATNALGSTGAESPPTAPVRPVPEYAIPLPALRFITPFPVVRIRGSVAARGSYVRLLRVRAPRSARVAIACSGRGCPVRRIVRRAGRVRRFERFLPAGLRLTVRVRRRGYVGKYVRLRIRAGRAPERRDACVISLRRRPVECPDA
jgi:hypothetical protein